MTHLGFVMITAVLLAMVGAAFRVGLARLLWSEDLQHTQELALTWEKSKAAMQRTIEVQQRHIEILRGKGP